jgi:hypothetical protein
MIDEEFMEDCIEECPKAFLGCELEILERQASLGGFRPDLICRHNQETWIVEIQQKALDRIHLYKCLEYRDLLKKTNDQSVIRVVVVCNSIDSKYLPLAETHGVEVVSIDRDKFVDLASQFCPKSVSKLIKRENDYEADAKPRLKTTYHFRPLGWTEHLSLAKILSHIYAECGRNNIKLSELRDEKYWSVIYEVENLLCRDWKDSFGSIVDPQKWHIDRLLCTPTEWQPDFLKDVKRIRKPIIQIRAFVTSQDNLSIVWSPKTDDHSGRGIYMVGDWAHWPGEDPYGWSRPPNELVFIREIDRLRPGEPRNRREPETCNWDVLDELFISLIRATYDWLCETLSSIVQVERVTDFEFELAEPSPGDFCQGDLTPQILAPKRIIRWSIYNLEVRRMEIEAKWINGFEKQYGVSLQRLIDIYNDCLSRGRNRVPANRTKYLATELQREVISISRSQLDEILVRLRKYHHHYSASLND